MSKTFGGFHSLLTVLTTLVSMSMVTAFPPRACPTTWRHSPFMADMGLLAEVASWDHLSVGASVDSCQKLESHAWMLTHEADGPYDTRMRVLERGNDTFAVFRPTQEAGHAIHDDRRLVQCRLFPHCEGLVHEKFQEAFLPLAVSLNWTSVVDKHQSLHIIGHSLGGSLGMLLGAWLFATHEVVPETWIGLGSPFVGDEAFHMAHVATVREAMRSSQSAFVVEAMDATDPTNWDGIAEGYETDSAPPLFVDHRQLCGIAVPVLPASYGMHDLREYRLAFPPCEEK